MRLVAKGFTQREGINYNETFFPISSKDPFKIIMILVAHFDLKLHQMDAKTTFLNGEIDETIYMELPENFIIGGSKSMVCKLKKSQMDKRNLLANGMTNFIESLVCSVL